MVVNGKEVSYKDATTTDILDWCEENGHLDYLLELVNTKAKKKRYPKIDKLDANGNPILGEDGKPIKVDDKEHPYEVLAPYTNLEIKKLFFTKFFGNELPKEKKKPTFADLVRARAKANKVK